MERLTELAGIYGDEKMYVLDTLDKKSKQDLINDLGRAEDLIEEKDKEIEKLKNMAVVDMQNGEMLELELKTLKTKAINLLKKFVKLAEKDKDIRHQVCEEIRDWYRERNLIIEIWLKRCLDQIEGESDD